MIACGNTPKLGASVLASALAFLVGSYAVTTAAYADETVAVERGDDFIPGSERASARPPATFFTINAVLEKLDRQRGRGPGALRTASVAPTGVVSDALPAPTKAPAASTEPFGLFTFRAPEG